MELEHARTERRDRVRRRRRGEHRGKQRLDKVVGRQIGEHERLAQPCLGNVDR
jgi:hypothetical protein